MRQINVRVGLDWCGNRTRSRARTEREAFFAPRIAQPCGDREPSTHEAAEDVFGTGAERDHRVSHDSDPASGHDPQSQAEALPKTKLPYTLSGRRGCCEDTCAGVLPNADHHGQRARSFVAPKPNQTKPIAAAN